MAINWFEGGRRISKLFIGIIAAAGAASVVFAGAPTPTLASGGPAEPWAVMKRSCNTPSYERFLWNFDWGGERKGLSLCFTAASNGMIPYEVAPEPPEEGRRRAEERLREEAADRARAARGEPPPIRFSQPERHWYYTADPYDGRVQQHVSERVAAFTLASEIRRELVNNQAAARWSARWKALEDALPWVLGLCVFIWLLTAVAGWVVRGFAGIPRGQDFKTPTGTA